jgi:hypothetical protein
VTDPAWLPDEWTPRTPDAPEQTDEFLPVVILHGREWGGRDPVDICTTYERAAELGEKYARNVGEGARYVILRRSVGPWRELS